ncbi:hypothetical protein BDW22DRAFT_300847 [Trametopsis cervina]|nr:hypothetical protein BDW22DRAFT_300847 [Trametopsis cervina]
MSDSKAYILSEPCFRYNKDSSTSNHVTYCNPGGRLLAEIKKIRLLLHTSKSLRTISKTVQSRFSTALCCHTRISPISNSVRHLSAFIFVVASSLLPCSSVLGAHYKPLLLHYRLSISSSLTFGHFLDYTQV